MSPATVVTEKGRIRILISAVAGTLISVTRQHPSGRILPVRGMTLVPLSGGSFIGWDYEAPIGIPVTYLATSYDTADLVNPLDTSDPVTVTWNTTYEWLKDPLEPIRNMAITVKEMNNYTYDSRTGVHVVLGRPAPVTVGEIRSSSSDTVTMLTYSQDERDRLHYLTASGNVLLLQSTQASGIGSMYIALLGVQESRLFQQGFRDSPQRVWTLTYQEVDPPIGDAGAFTTWNDVVTQYATWEDVVATWATWIELVESLTTAEPPPILAWRGA